MAALAGVPARDRLRVGALALWPRRRRPRLVVALAARGLDAPGRGHALGRWARAARVRGLAPRAGATAAVVPALLEARDPADRGAARGRDLPQHRAAPAPVRPVERGLRAGAAGQARARLARAPLGRGPPLPRAPEARARRAAVRGAAAQPRRRECGRDGDPARRGGSGGLETAASAAEPVKHRGRAALARSRRRASSTRAARGG